MAQLIDDSDTSRVFSDAPLEEISARCDVITTTSLVACYKRYLYSATHSASLSKSNPFGLPCVLHTHPTEVPREYDVFYRDNRMKQFYRGSYYCDRGKQNPQKMFGWSLCELKPLDRSSSDAVMPDCEGKKWADSHGDWIATGGLAWNWELVNGFTHRRIPLPAIFNFEATREVLKFIAAGQPTNLLKIVICQVPTTARNYKYFSVLAISDTVIPFLDGSHGRWMVLENQFSMFSYRDAIIHKGVVYDVTQIGNVYAWDPWAWGPVRLLGPPQLDGNREYSPDLWWLERSPDGGSLILINTAGVSDKQYDTTNGGYPVAENVGYHHDRNIHTYCTGFCCHVFSIDTSRLLPPRQWWRVLDLGLNYSITIPVGVAGFGPGDLTRRNCVYTSPHVVSLGGFNIRPEICRFSMNAQDTIVGFSTNNGWNFPPKKALARIDGRLCCGSSKLGQREGLEPA